ncbi:MAG TPA: hypothetical protein VLX61_00540 [Anaerolineales bacterium]|nr:hypothetical protein [Anaerolineales bacterium]
MFQRACEPLDPFSRSTAHLDLLILEMGMPVNTVQQRSGHPKPGVTTDIYGHPMARSRGEAAQKIEEAITPIAVYLQ